MPVTRAELRAEIERLKHVVENEHEVSEKLKEENVKQYGELAEAQDKVEKLEFQYHALREKAEWALRGLEQLAREEAKRKGTTFEMCDYTFAKGLRGVLDNKTDETSTEDEGEECRRCDGCGWYEGGPTLQTNCEECGGTGVIKTKDTGIGTPHSHQYGGRDGTGYTKR